MKLGAAAIVFATSGTLFSQATLQGEGWGDSRENAGRQALGALAKSLQVEVKSSFCVE